mmetsp:Transcript_5589/g.8633  ORF Transcript_5589/g.8633 Transcript_5589/m.8633 type:complete len:93 (-) Transcript_5589:981-1259(-)
MYHNVKLNIFIISTLLRIQESAYATEVVSAKLLFASVAAADLNSGILSATATILFAFVSTRGPNHNSESSLLKAPTKPAVPRQIGTVYSSVA